MLRVIMLGFIILSAATLTACPSKQCTPKMARCQGSVTQICRPDGKWQNVVDCTKVDKVPWSCGCTDPKTCRCKKPEVAPRP